MLLYVEQLCARRFRTYLSQCLESAKKWLKKIGSDAAGAKSNSTSPAEPQNLFT